MNKKQIVEQTKKMKGKEDLLALLNQLKKDEITELRTAQPHYPFTIHHLNYYCNPNHEHHRFEQFEIKKKSGGTRLITAPRNESYKLILHYLNEIFKALYTPSEHTMGFTTGRSVVTNAAAHRGMNYVFNIDLKDFFPSIAQARVWKRLQLAPLNFPVAVASVIAGLCSMKETRLLEDGTTQVSYVLPQGAPTSPILTNMICDKLDRRLAGLAKRFKLNYTRYADDITFSSMHNVYASGGEFRTELERIISDQGFVINDKKTRLQKLGSRQEVTGIIVSQQLNVTRKYVRDIRNLLYIWDRYGHHAAQARFAPKYSTAKEVAARDVPNLEYVLVGKLMYLKMVKGADDPVFQRFYQKYCLLAHIAPKPFDKNTTQTPSGPVDIDQLNQELDSLLNI